MMAFFQAFASLIVLAEALNKLHRCDVFSGVPRASAVVWLLTPWRWSAKRVSAVMKVVAWALLAVGAFHILITSALPTLQASLTIAGVATMIVRTRMKELTP
jgi:hypothetical protein